MMPNEEPFDILKERHRSNALLPIDGYDEVGAWRESIFSAWLTDAVPLVIDTNVLRNCIGPTAKRGTPTALATIANTRAARVYCAPYVIGEIREYTVKWAAEYGVTTEAFRSAFESTYLPLLRVVATDGLEKMLLPSERARIDILRGQDPDDVPTSTIAIALGALPVTMDPRPWEAVYGVSADTDSLQKWVERLTTVGDRGETEKLLTGTYAGVGGAAALILYGATSLYRISRISFALVTIALGAAALRVPLETYRQRWIDVQAGFGRLNDALLTPHVEASAALQRELPPFPSWDELVAATSRDAALARACLYRLSRTRRTPAKASDISSDLPTLTIGQAAPRVGTVLRQFPSFFEVEPYAWQVGKPEGFG